MAKPQPPTENNEEVEQDEFYPHSDPQSIKYRAIGASIIMVSCSLAWWLFLDHESKRYQSIESVVKEPLNVERFEIPPEVIQKQHDYQLRRQAENNTETMATAKRVEIVSESTDYQTVDRPKVEKAKKPVTVRQSEPSKLTKVTQQPVKKASVSETPKNTHSAKVISRQPPNVADAWVLQLGSFTDKKNAESLRQTLYKSDISAYIKRFNIDERVIYRVIVGPKLDRDSVEKMQSKVRKKSGIQPVIVKFKIGFEE